jgi:chromosome segregation ATPase
VEERETLHNLNSRLQYFLTRMKELEARNSELQTRVDSGATSSKTQSEQMRGAYEKELSELRRSQDKDLELIAELKARAATHAAKAIESDKVAASHKRKAERCDELEAKWRQAGEERERLAGALKAEEERAEKAAQAAAVAEAKAALLEKKLAPLREQLATAEELRRKEGATFRETIDELTGVNRGELARMQAAYDAQLKDALDAAKTRADEERAAEVEQLAAHFQTVEAELSREAGEEREAKQAAQKRAAELAISTDELLKRVNAAERRVAELDRELSERGRALDTSVATLQAQLESARARRESRARDAAPPHAARAAPCAHTRPRPLPPPAARAQPRATRARTRRPSSTS